MTEPVVIDTRSGFRQAVQQAVERATAARAREMWWADAHFQHWPLDEPAFVEAVDRFVHLPQRRIVLFTFDFQALARQFPRFVQWRRHWSHCVHGHRPLELEPASLETLLLADSGDLVTLVDPPRFRGSSQCGGIEPALARARIDAISQRSEEAFTSVVLGL